MTLVEFLTARLDEDEATALACPPWPWRIDPHFADEETVLAADDIEVAEVFALSGPQTRAAGAHITRHDPARVLREVEAKRAIVALAREAQQRMMDGPDFHKDGTFHTVSAWTRTTLVHLAAVYADHPDHDEEWRP